MARQQNTPAKSTKLSPRIQPKQGEKAASIHHAECSNPPGYIVPTCLFIGMTSVYMLTTYPGIAGGDSGELLSAACVSGVAHPPGYPLWTMMSTAIMSLIPIGSPAWRVSVLNCCCAGASAAVLYCALSRLTGSMTGSSIAVLLYALSPLVWTWSVTAEVFALNNLITASLLLLLAQFEFSLTAHQRHKAVLLGCLVMGFGLCNQHTIVLYLPFLAGRILYKLHTVSELSVRLVFRSAAAGLAGLSAYIYLPIRSYQNAAVYTWGDQTNAIGFLTHLLRQEYGTFKLGKDGVGKGFLYNLAVYKISLLSEYQWLGYALGCLGLVQAFIDCSHSARRTTQISLLMMSSYVIFFCWRANLDMDNHLFREVTERFWMQPHMIWCLLVAMGYKLIHIRLSMRFHMTRLMKTAVIAAISAYSLYGSFNSCNHHDNRVVDDFAESLMRSFPADSLVLTHGDMPFGTFRYKQYCEGVRDDVILLDQELFTYDWFVPKMRNHLHNVHFPGDQWHKHPGRTTSGAVLFDMEQFINSNYGNRSIFVCIGMQEYDNSWQRSYHLLPYGPCHQVVSMSSPSDWSELSHPYNDSWTKTYQKYREGSWEKIANDEMWNAKVVKALHLYNEASADNNDIHKHWEAYNAYKEVMDSHEHVPVYFHKNYALSCHQMALSRDALPGKRAQYARLALKHFTVYSESGADDSQMSAILSLIQALKTSLDQS